MVDGGLKMLLNGCRCALDRAARFGNLRARMGAWPHIWIEVGIKMKKAAQGRRSGNHRGRHRILKYFREHRGLESCGGD